MRPEVLALIPARGGSKGVPRKNIRIVAGRPMIAWTIDHARRSAQITRIIVSTEDDEIASVAREHGAEVPFRRPPEYATDDCPDLPVFRHALTWLAEHEGYRPELVVHLRASDPVRRVDLVDAAIAVMRAHPEADALRSVSTPQQTPFKMWRRGRDGFLQPVATVEGMPDAHSAPRQLLPEVWWQNGYVDVVRPRTVLELGSMVGEKLLPFPVAEPSFEVDYEDDIPRLEAALLRLAKDQVRGGASEVRRLPV